MSAAFTTLTAGENALSLAMANEIVLAYSERRQALGQSAQSALTAGTSAQDKTLWLAMQTWLEANCTSFIDHVSGPLNPGGTDFLYFTLATWRAAAGLNASGFRRTTDGTTFAYGNITAGDVWGKWSFEDLQKAFGALKWAPWNIGTISGDQWGSGTQSGSDWDVIKAAAIAAWKKISSGTVDYLLCLSYLEFTDSKQCSLNRYAVDVYANSLPTIERTPLLYARGDVPAAGETKDYTFNGNSDLTNLLAVVDTLAESSSADIYSSHFNVTTVPVWGSTPSQDYITHYTGYWGYLAANFFLKWLMKWNFTNA